MEQNQMKMVFENALILLEKKVRCYEYNQENELD